MENKQNEIGGLLDKFFLQRRTCMHRKALRLDLYAGQPPVLAFIMDHPGCTQNEIADHLSVTPASIAFSTKRMQKNGLIQKQVNANDMRCNKLYLTPHGKEVMESFDTEYKSLNKDIFNGFDQDELDQFSSFILRLQKNLDEILSEKEKYQ